jgi:L-ascorbate metabolism protein UlaG (beta-lactamase superfamily)
MVITYYGLSCFKIQSGETTLVFDLPGKKSEIKGLPADRQAPRFHADIVLQSHNYSSGEIPKDSFLIDGPGEYEVRGVYVRGLKSYHDSSLGKKHGLNTIYILRLENMNLCFLGDFGEKELRPESKEGIGKVDVLFVPITGENVLDAEGARNIINQIEPAIAVPAHYLPAGGKGDALKKFLGEMGQKDIKSQEKLSIKKKDIKENGTEVVVLEKQG